MQVYRRDVLKNASVLKSQREISVSCGVAVAMATLFFAFI